MYACCDERRRDAIREHRSLNGIDYLEVQESDRRTLRVRFVKDLADDATPAAKNVLVEGGERIRNVKVESATAVEGEPDVLEVTVDREGDPSTYRLRLVDDEEGHQGNPNLLAAFDPLLAAVEFSFRVDRGAEFDPEPPAARPLEDLAEPALDYLAKDYASFRHLMLDRLSTLMPGWRERNPADLQVALVELLAYVGDELSYRQDAVATEAYLGTARRRVSVRRHARLVDYHMHDGSNARAWVQVRVTATEVRLAAGTRLTLLTRVAGKPRRVGRGSREFGEMLSSGAEVFETLVPRGLTLRRGHNDLRLYAWGNRECCLPRGATGVTLRGDQGTLSPGDVLVFKEALGPRTGRPEDADPDHRHAVRLTRVTRNEDPLGGRFEDPPTDAPAPVTEVEWHAEDALPFPLCVSAKTDEEHGGEYVEDVSLALGNIVLADHGLTLREEELLGTVPETRFVAPVPSPNRPERSRREPVYPRFRPALREGPVTQAAKTTVTDPVTKERSPSPFDPDAPAAAATRWEMREVLPEISLRGTGALWEPRRDLLRSGPADLHYVAEVEADGSCYLRFGDDESGARPNSGSSFSATYRVGNGARGNVGAGAIWHLVADDAGISPSVEGVSNPMPAGGGVEPESVEEVRQRAPYAFRTQQRAVTPDDYAEILGRHPSVQRAAATIRWTGSWRTVFLTVDPVGGGGATDGLEGELRRYLEPYRMAGYDIEIDGPRYVSLEIEMLVSVEPDSFRSAVKADLLEAFGSGPGGGRGLFHPDNFTFGQTVYLSPLYVAAQAVEGVAWVHITRFRRQGVPDVKALERGKLTLGRLEIARLDNHPDFPERGVLRLIMQGGK